MDDVLFIKKKKFVIESTLATHPDHTTYACIYSGVRYMVRVYREGYEQMLADYKILKIIAFDYFPEPDVLEVLAKGDLPEKYFEALFSLYRFARFSRVALDWEPQNFMLRGSQMFYLPIKVRKMDDKNGLEKGGLAAWFRGKELKKILEKKGYDLSNYKAMDDALVNKQMTLMAVKYW